MAKKKRKPTSAEARKGRPAKLAAEPAYFLSLSVTNVRCFGSETQTLDLSDGNGGPAPWTIILGNNGTGKTTLLQALLACSRPTDKGVPGFWKFDFRRAGVEDEAAIVAIPRPAGRISRTSPCAQLIGCKIRQTMTGGENSRHYDRMEHVVCNAYGAGRRMGTGSLAPKDTFDDVGATLVDETAPLRNAEEWLLRADYRAAKSQNARHRRPLQQVRELLIDILPDVDSIRFVGPDDSEDYTRVEFRTPYGWVPLQGISYGYQTLMAWMVDFASRMVERYPRHKDPLAQPAVVLVDEIDLHLHPSWQRKLMSYLTERFPNTQFIATAHSPLIVQAAPEVNANIVVLRREGDHVVIDNDVEAVRGWRADQILTSDLFELPTARPAEFDEAIKHRTKLLSKSRLTKADREKLKALDAKLGDLPAGETASEAREMLQLARETAELLKNNGKKKTGKSSKKKRGRKA